MQAFDQIYETYSQRLFNFLFSRLKHRQTAEDLLHTVFLKAWNNIGTYQQQGAKFSTWLFQIANYTVIDHWRTKKQTVELDKVENLSQLSLNPTHYEDYRFLWEAMDKLSLDHRLVLELRFKQDLTVAETAAVMKKTLIGVRVLQHRAVKALKKKLEQYQPEKTYDQRPSKK